MLQCKVPHKLKVCISGVFPGKKEKEKRKKINTAEVKDPFQVSVNWRLIMNLYAPTSSLPSYNYATL